MMTKLSKRQQIIVDASKKVRTTIDVGCDHGYVGLSLLENKKTKFLIASDISEKCAQKAKILLEEKNFSSFSETRVGFGITAKQKEKIDQAIIAGMGGHEICEILKNFENSKSIKHFVLQPMKELENLRLFLNENGFKILKDFVFEDKKKFYHLLTAKPGKQKLSSFQTRWGAKSHKKNKEFFVWLKQKQTKLENILKKLTNEKDRTKLENCLEETKKLKTQKETNKC